MTASRYPVFTVGHSAHSLETFVALLRRHRVTAVADVRSAPYSRFHPHFTRGSLERSLLGQGIQYVFLGRELGARPDDPSCYDGGRVVFERLANRQTFLSGIERVVRGADEHCVALMCAEKDPLVCHRTLLVARALADRGVVVKHILADGSLESHESTMERLLDVTGLPHEDLFRSKGERLAEAISRQEKRIGHVLQRPAVEGVGQKP